MDHGPAAQMMAAFQQLMIDGESLDLAALLRHLKRFDDAPWVDELRGTLTELMGSSAAISVKTSGTTGKPKVISFEREELIASANLTGEFFGLDPGDKALLCLPTRYIAGKMMVVRAMVLGLDLQVIAPGSDIPPSIMKPAIRFAAMVPLQLEKALSTGKEFLEANFNKIILGGGPLPPVLEKRIAGLDIAIWHTYGMTETCTHVAARPLTKLAEMRAQERDSQYSAIGAVHFTQDERGCLVVHTPQLRTKVHLSNDVVQLHDPTHFNWLGRWDNVVLSGGIKLYPEELESRCASLVDRPFYFTAKPDEELGEAMIGVMEGEPLLSGEVAELMNALTQVLSKYELPKRWVFMDQLPRNENGKVMRSAFSQLKDQ